jgi:Anticodon binding domain
METTSSVYTINEIKVRTNFDKFWELYHKEKEEIDGHTKKALLFLKDKINKFSDITNWLSDKCLCGEAPQCYKKCGQYKHLLIQNRPIPTFMEGTDTEDLKKELRKYLGILWYDIEVGIFEELSEYIGKQDKEYRKKYMPNLNLILFGSRNAPSTKELIDILGRKETEARIQIALNKLS